MTEPFDPSRVLAGLKDFQRDTVEYVFQRMYLDEDPARRFLVADEVGLGKTLVARGVIAKAIQHLESSVERIDVLYICSNADIAKQNIARLNVVGSEKFTHASRITLLPKEIQDFDRLNFISFTPGTSLDLKSSMGRAEERVLLYWLLRGAWGPEVVKGTGARRLLQGGVEGKRFERYLRQFDPGEEISPRIQSTFGRDLTKHDAQLRKARHPTLRHRFEELCDAYRYPRKSRPEEQWRGRRELIGELRHLLATTCVDALEPDLVILDEFQRFRSVLDGESQAAQLARAIFDYEKGHEHAKVLLLSATPYKMYTLHGEAAEDNHYEDFVRTLRFLAPDDVDRITDEFREYRRALLRLSGEGAEAVRRQKARLEDELRRVMVRTERLAVGEDRNGMLAEQASDALLGARDITEYLALHGLAQDLDAPDAIELWKSAPYLLNFMEDYKLKRVFDQALEAPGNGLSRLPGEAFLSWDEVEEYEAVDPGNARLRALVEDVVESGAWQLLWVPAALPYYEPEAPYDGSGLEGFTKRLIFSSWTVVPKAIASLVSYEAERRIAEVSDQLESYRSRSDMSQLLQFTRERRTDASGEERVRLRGMPVLGIVYPSPTLARLGDPREVTGDGRPSLDRVMEVVRDRIRPRLESVTADAPDDGPADEAWYWAASMLLDARDASEGEEDWNELWWSGHDDLAGVWLGVDGTRDHDHGAFAEHVEHAREVLLGREQLGRPPRDLLDVVAELAVGGPAVAALRALSRVAGGAETLTHPHLRDDAAAVAWAFRNLFNLPESMAIIRGTGKHRGEDPYWRQVVEYAINGGLQAVLDEYVHMLPEALGLLDQHPLDISDEVAKAICQAMSLRATRYGIDVFRTSGGRVEEDGKRNLRGHFALRFGETRSEDGESSRPEQVRNAFNSPFWPFVLASTSVGQEGLDFHTYCHAVVHWNLPANPVDLEQREGRVHRYKGHAIRKNVAQACGREAFGEEADPWAAMFDSACALRADGENELVPFWVLPGEAKIERYVPTLPLSRDVAKLEDLKRTVGAYRLAFGQPRQEDLVAYLRNRLSDDEVDLSELQIDLSPPAMKWEWLDRSGCSEGAELKRLPRSARS